MYTIKEIAEKYKVTTTTVYRWIHTGKLQSIKLGDVVRVTDEQLNEFVNMSSEKMSLRTSKTVI